MSVVFCPQCGNARTGPVCGNCGYDYLKGAQTPAVTLSRGVNPVSLIVGLVMLVIVVGVLWLVLPK